MALHFMGGTVCKPLSIFCSEQLGVILTSAVVLAIRTCHEDMWETVKERLHWPQKVFTLGQRSLEYVVIGKVEYWDKDRAYSSCNMAAHFQCQRNAGSGAVEITWGRIWVS